MQKWNITTAKFLRKNERPEQLNELQMRLELRIENIKLVCQAVGKKLLACLQLHGVEREKRLKKLPESGLSKQLHESSSTFDEKDTIRQTLHLCGNVEGDLASMLMSYEDNIEMSVLQPLQALLERDIPAITKLRKQVAKQNQEVDSLKSRTRQTVVVDKAAEGSKKTNQALEDLEEANYKLELYKDQLVTEMYNFYAREGELNKLFIYLIESQLKYHADATAALQRVLPDIKLIEESCQRPVFGCSLEDHLRLTRQRIATVISESIKALLVEGLDQEGLFRIAGGATKLKKLKATFDAGMADMDEYVGDPHCVASVLKLYLRELPEPLLTFELYDEWTEASQLPPEQRLNAIAGILKRMKRPYYDNLKYLMQFLSKLADNAEVNKMSATNLAIVVGPNLLWSRNDDGQNILTTGVQSSIAESMISHATLLFGDDSELGEMMMTSRVVSSSQPPGAGSTSRGDRDDDNYVTTKQTMGKVDSSDSLSSDSLCAETAAVITNASSSSSFEVPSMTRTSEIPDFSNLVAPKRTAKKTLAPLPPGADATAQVVKVTVAPVARTPATTSGNHEASSSTVPTKVAVTSAALTKVAMATAETTGDAAAKPATTTVAARVAMTTAQANVAVGSEDTEVPPRKSLVESNPVATVAAGDEKAQPIGGKRSTQFAANRALIGNVLSGGPRKLLLTRPNTVYMESAKQELIKTAEEPIDGETTTPPKFETNGAGYSSLGKAGDGEQADGEQRTEDDGSTGRDAKKDDPSIDDMCAAAELIGNLDSETETKNPSPQGQRRSDGASALALEEPVRKKPDRPSKPVRSGHADAEGGGGRPSGDARASVAEDQPGKESSSVVESSSAAKPPGGGESGARTHSASTSAKHPKHPPPEVPHTVPPQQPSSAGGAGARPPKPPPPSVAAAAGSRLPSDFAVEEDTYL